MHLVERLGLWLRQAEHAGGLDLESLLLEEGDDVSRVAAGKRVGLDDRERAIGGHEFRIQ